MSFLIADLTTNAKMSLRSATAMLEPVLHLPGPNGLSHYSRRQLPFSLLRHFQECLNVGDVLDVHHIKTRILRKVGTGEHWGD